MKVPSIHSGMGKQQNRAFTLTELIMVLLLVSVLILIILPQFRLLYKSWDLKEASAETLQHGRILFDHLQRALSTATAISAMSDASEPIGYLEYADPDGQVWRYEVNVENYVAYGQPGDLSVLAGPVSQFQISGYAADDLENSTTDVSSIRLIRIQTGIASPSHPGKTCEFSVSACLRASSDSSVLHVLFVVANPGSLDPYEQRLNDRFTSWGYVVTLIDNDAPQEDFDTAVTLADVAYIPATCDCQALGNKLTLTPIGVVSEHGDCHDDMNYTSQEASSIWSAGVRILDNTNPITAPYTIDEYVTVLSVWYGNLLRVRGSIGSGMQPLARRLLQNHTMMGAYETNSLLQGGQPAPGRRVALPWGSDTFDNSWLNDEGWGITQRSIEWAGGG